MRASAPGKILVAGEYAVLEGGPAVVMAVDRRARAWFGPVRPMAGAPSPFLAAAAAAIARELGPDSPAARAARAVVVDTGALCASTGAKLGLGSSAAATVAALAACLGAGPEPMLDRSLLHRLAHRAHGEAQARLAAGARGSGADVAASVWGGCLLLEPAAAEGEPPAATPLAFPPDLELVPVWTGRPADTRALVSATRALAGRDPAAHRACLAELARAAAMLVDACRAASAARSIAAIAAGGRAVRALGDAAGVPLFIEGHRILGEVAASLGGALKPTGAGGGDIALAAFDRSELALQFRSHVVAAGMQALDLRVDPDGAALEHDSA